MERKAGKGKFAAEAAVLIFCLLLLGIYVSRKEGYHMDELLSFELANAKFNPWIVPTQPEGRLAKFVRSEIDGDTPGETLRNFAAQVKDVLENRGDSRLLTYRADVYPEPVWITGEQFLDYITVREGDAFNYLSVCFNVKDDNHPPLHFMLLHTVSSVFRGKAVPWMGCAVNLAAAAGILILLMRLGELLAGQLGMGEASRKAGLFCALLYGLSAGAAATVLLIRMYALVTLWCAAYLYLVLIKWRDGSFDRRNGGLILVTALGFWTQYFFLFYCVCLALTAAVMLARRKSWRQLWGFVRSMLAAAALGLALFPFAVSDVFSSGRGVEALENLFQGLRGYGERLGAFGKILLERTLNPWLLLLFTAVGAAVLARGVAQRMEASGKEASREKLSEESGKEARGESEEEASGEETLGTGAASPAKPEGAGRGGWAALLLIPMAGYFLLAARMSPYLVDRYVMPLFPLAALAVTLALFALLQRPEVPGAIRGVVLALAVLLQFANVLRYDGSYLYRGYAGQERLAAENAGKDCICVYEGVGYYENLKEFTYYKQTLLLKSEELEGRQDRESIESLQEVLLLIKDGVDAEAVLSLFREQYGLCPQQKLLEGGVHGDEIYLLRKGA